MEHFAGRVAVVTGAGSGIGRAMARRFAAEGMVVVAADVEVPTLEETVSLIAGDGGRAIAAPTDVSDAGAVEALADTAFGECGAVHVLCNNAGVFSGGLLWERTARDWEWVLGVNLYGIVHAINSFVPRMLTQGEEAHIVNTASMGGLFTNAYSGPYYTSKFAAVGLSECLAHDLAAQGADIAVSVLVPSLVATGIGTSRRNRPERLLDRRLDEDLPADVAFIETVLADSTAAGMPPDEVAQLVLDAVRAKQFYIPTKPSFDAQMTERFEDLLAKRLPRTPSID
jgi:NAD(P)-dependent dehydrogenase (short-subunit alcohol dehydrogenase family)